jgi:epoxide hydrolase-like predicted phosphatase
MIKALIFDCFGVFYTDPVFKQMHDPQLSPEDADELHNLDESAARGQVSKASFDQQASKLLQRSPQEVEQQFFHSGSRNQALIDLAQELRTTYKIALLSNIGVDMMDGFFSPSERTKLFDTVVLSGEVGYAKPDPEIFELTCKRLGVLPNETVMIDDVESNVAAAKALGMQGIRYKNIAQCKTELDAILKGA